MVTAERLWLCLFDDVPSAVFPSQYSCSEAHLPRYHRIWIQHGRKRDKINCPRLVSPAPQCLDKLQQQGAGDSAEMKRDETGCGVNANSRNPSYLDHFKFQGHFQLEYMYPTMLGCSRGEKSDIMAVKVTGHSAVTVDS